MLIYDAFTPNSVFKSVLPFGLRTYLTKQHVILRCCSANLCKWNYLYGNPSFYKIKVNHFMAQDEPFGAKIIPKCTLWVRGLVPFWVLRHSFLSLTASLVAQLVKNLPAMQETGVRSLSWQVPLEKENGNPLRYPGPGKSHGQRSLVDCSPWGRKESGTTERLTHTSNLIEIFTFNDTSNKSSWCLNKFLGL